MREHLFANGVDRDIIHLNDMKFFKTITYVLVSRSHISAVHSFLTLSFFLQVNFFSYKIKITQQQFFKYGFAEMKMLLCCDVIKAVKQKHKQLRMQRSISAKRVMLSRTKMADSGRFSLLDHDQGKQSHYHYERDAQTKSARVNSLTRDLQTNTPRKISMR